MFSINYTALGMAIVSYIRKIVTALGCYFTLYVIGYFANPFIDSAIGETRPLGFAMGLWGYPLVGLVVGFLTIAILGCPIALFLNEYNNAKTKLLEEILEDFQKGGKHG
jgi:hypothetical protein